MEGRQPDCDRTKLFIAPAGFTSPAKDLSQTVPLKFVAPSQTGTYWIMAVLGGDDQAVIGSGNRVPNLLSATSGTVASAPVWNDGNDIVDWSLATIQIANENGTVQVPYLYRKR